MSIPISARCTWTRLPYSGEKIDSVYTRETVLEVFTIKGSI